MPEVLTVIPTYNASHFLPATLDCLAAQTRRPDRIVVIDNGSTDRTPELVRSHPELKIEFLQNPTNIGVLGNLNRCLEFAAETDYLHLLMADDLVRPTFMARSLEALKDEPGQALAYVFDDKINQHGKVVLEAPCPADTRARRVPLAEFIRRHAGDHPVAGRAFPDRTPNPSDLLPKLSAGCRLRISRRMRAPGMLGGRDPRGALRVPVERDQRQQPASGAD